MKSINSKAGNLRLASLPDKYFIAILRSFSEQPSLRTSEEAFEFFFLKIEGFQKLSCNWLKLQKTVLLFQKNYWPLNCQNCVSFRSSCWKNFLTVAFQYEIFLAEAAIRRSVRKVFLKISQNSQENTCARISFLRQLQAKACNIIKKRNSGTGVFLWILRSS